MTPTLYRLYLVIAMTLLLPGLGNAQTEGYAAAQSSASPAGFNNHFAVKATTRAVSISGLSHTAVLSGLCSYAPCTLTWMGIPPDSKLGSLSKQDPSGRISVFTAGTLPGTVWVLVHDEFGNTEKVEIHVVP